jgi:aminoglycoside 6-adenylyltransferase
MRTESDVIAQLKRWAAAQANVRTMILTSSRANPHRQPDVLSDYDVEVFVRDVTPFAEDDAWVRKFGEIMVRWPIEPAPTFSNEWITQLVLYEDGTRIDFQVTALPPSASENLDAGYRVLVDKDGVGAALSDPTYLRYHVQPPTPEAFVDRMNAFWWDIVYVAKGPLLRWHVVLHYEQPVNVGVYGRWLHQYLDPELWSLYRQTFAAADFEDNWRALFATLELTRRVGHDIAHSCDFPYPEATDRKVTDYIRWIRELDLT